MSGGIQSFFSSFNCPLSLVLVLVLNSVCLSDPPAGYYDPVDQSTTATFRQTLHGVIDDHKKIPYTSTAVDTWDVLEEGAQSHFAAAC